MTKEVYDKATDLFYYINNYEKAVNKIDESTPSIFILVKPDDCEYRIRVYGDDYNTIAEFLKNKLESLKKELEAL